MSQVEWRLNIYKDGKLEYTSNIEREDDNFIIDLSEEDILMFEPWEYKAEIEILHGRKKQKQKLDLVIEADQEVDFFDSEENVNKDKEMKLYFQEPIDVAIDSFFSDKENVEKFIAPFIPIVEDGYTPQKWVDYDDGYTPIKGKDYKDGEDWITPIKWKDYFTKKELQEIKKALKDTILSEMPEHATKDELNLKFDEILKKIPKESRIEKWATFLRQLLDVKVGNPTATQYWLTYNPSTSEFTLTEITGGGGWAVDSVNSQTGVVVLDTDDITDTATNRYTNDTDITRLANTSGTNTGDQVGDWVTITWAGTVWDPFVAVWGSSWTVTSVAISGSDWLEVDSGSPITTNGTIALWVNKTALLSHINVEDGAEVNTIDTVSDTSEIDLTITARALSASIVASSIDESKLDASVNASLDLADTAVQPAGLSGYELLSNKATDFTTINNTLYPTVQAVNTAINTAVTGLLDYRGSYDASANLFPATGGSGILGAILSWDFWICSVAGTLGGTPVTLGDLIIAIVDTPWQTAGNWDLIENTLGYTPENVANKENTTIDTNTTKYPTVNLLKTGLDTKQATLVSGTNIKTVNSTTLLGSGDLAVATTAQGALADSALQPWDIASGTITARADDINFSGGSDGDVLTVQADGSLALEAAAAGGANVALSNLSGVAINTSLISDTNNTDDIGSTGVRWKKWWFVDMEVTNPIAGSITGNAATVTTNANLTWPVTSTGNATAIANWAISNAMLANSAVANLSGTNTGDQTSVSGNAWTATALATPRTIGTLTGDVTSTGSSFDGSANNTNSTTIANSAVTLAKMADLAQDQFIGRTTASTGVPQTATITAAARTVLDDTTVADMVNTLWGATSTGTGWLVRAGSPALITPSIAAITVSGWLMAIPTGSSDTLVGKATTDTLTNKSISLGTNTLTTTVAQLNTAITDGNIVPEAGGTFTGDISVPDEAYGSGWNGSVEVPTKNAIYDKIETLSTPTCTAVIPQANYPMSGAVTNRTNGSVNTTAWCGSFSLPIWITVNKITVRCNTVSVAGSVKIGIYSEDGQTQKFSVTTASIAAWWAVTTAVSSVALTAGMYYIVWCLSGTADLTLQNYTGIATIADALTQGITSEPILSGTLAISASTLPTTFNPVTDITAQISNCLAFRLDN